MPGLPRVPNAEAIDIDDLKSKYPNLEIIHLTVDTKKDNPKDWFIIGKETRK